MRIQDLLRDLSKPLHESVYKDLSLYKAEIDEAHSEIISLTKEIVALNTRIDALTPLPPTKVPVKEKVLKNSLFEALESILKGTQVDMPCYINKRKVKDKGISISLGQMIRPEQFEVQKLKKSLKLTGKVYNDVYTAGNWMAANVTWTDDKNLDNSGDYYLYPEETLVFRKADCFAGYEEIYTASGTKKISEIKAGDIVLSYDFDTKKFVYKKISKHWSKGKLQVNRVHLRNGQHIDVSEDHPMWVRDKYKDNSYIKKPLSQIDLTKWYKRKIPIAVKIPYNIVQPKWHKDLYVVMGHFLAEGWTDKKRRKASSSGYDLMEHIIPLLEKHNIPFTEYRNNSGVPCINFLKSEFKDWLLLHKTNSFDIHIAEEVLSSPPEYLEALLYGMWLGDGTKNLGTSCRARDWAYATSSKQLAEDIQRIGLQLGRTFHIWKQNDHKGVGRKPIYRITHTPNSYFLQDHGFKDISEVSISYIEKLNNIEMFDLTVEDTHTVVMKNGVITHQCEDHAFVMASLFPGEVGVCYGFYVNGKESFGHAFNIIVDDGKLYVVDTVGDSVEVKLLEGNTNFIIHYVITQDKAYMIKSGVDFGIIAKWD